MSFKNVILANHRLTTAEIFYFLPDFPLLLQTYLWQEFDLAPDFPVLRRFLEFWERELDGRLHSVNVASCELITPTELRLANGEFLIH